MSHSMIIYIRQAKIRLIASDYSPPEAMAHACRRRLFGKAQRLRGDAYAICHRTVYLSPATGPFCRGHSSDGRGTRRPGRLRGPLATTRSVGPGSDRLAGPCRGGADLAAGIRAGRHACRQDTPVRAHFTGLSTPAGLPDSPGTGPDPLVARP